MATLFVSNEARARYLYSALSERVHDLHQVTFDPPRLWCRLIAALLTVRHPKVAWYRARQVHPVMQHGRFRAFRANAVAYPDVARTIMWGSWFAPVAHNDAPFVCYIDQSISLEPQIDGYPNTTIGLARAHEWQRQTYARARKVLCMSDWARQQTIRSFPSVAAKVVSVGWGPCGLDLSSEDRPSRPVRQVLHVSNDWSRKGVDFLIDTARLVRDVEPDTEFLVIGDDASKLAVSDEPGVQFIRRRLSGKEFEDAFRTSDLFFLPYRFDRSPHVLVEAMSASMPFVASAQGGAIELAEKGCGLVCPVGDIRGYAEAILSLIRDSERARAIGMTGHRMSRLYYNWGSVADRVLGAFTGD